MNSAGDTKAVVILSSKEERPLIGLGVQDGVKESKSSLTVYSSEDVGNEQGSIVYTCTPFDLEEGESEGTLDLYFSLFPSYRVAVISMNGQAIIFQFSSWDVAEVDNKTAREEFMAFQQNAVYLEETYVPFLQGLVEHVIEDDQTETARVLEHLEQQVPLILKQLYLPAALLEVPEDQIEQYINVMQKNGFYEILGKDGELVRALALLGVCCPFTQSREAIASLFAGKEMDLDAFITALQKYAEQYEILKIYGSRDKKILLCFI